jgi:hypothetical protein
MIENSRNEITRGKNNMKNKKLKTINDPVCLMIMKGTNIIINWGHLFSSWILHHIALHN